MVYLRTGGPALKNSAAYPKEFAEAVCKKHLDYAVPPTDLYMCMQ